MTNPGEAGAAAAVTQASAELAALTALEKSLSSLTGSSQNGRPGYAMGVQACAYALAVLRGIPIAPPATSIEGGEFEVSGFGFGSVRRP